MAWEKGKSGNPAGRPKGAKDKLTNVFWTDFLHAWQGGGREALAEVRDNDPSTFIRVAASLMPKETEVTLRNELDQMTDAELREFIKAELASGSSGSAEVEEQPSSAVTH